MNEPNDALTPFAKPKILLAVLLTLAVPGLGHFYVGRLRRGIVLFLVTYTVVFLATPLASLIPDAPVNIIAGLTVILGAWIFLLTDVIVIALRSRATPPDSLGPGGVTYVVIIMGINALLFIGLVAYKVTFYEAFSVPSGSMEDTIVPGDHVMVEKFAYGFRLPLIGTRLLPSTPRRGDLVIYRPPDKPSRMFLHRLVAIPGDRVQVADHRLFLNDQPVDEPHVKLIEIPAVSSGSSRGGHFGPVLVPDGMAFVLGDNRAASLDSRYVGFIPLSSVYGQVKFIYWSRLARGSVAWKPPSRPIRWERIGQVLE